jgi:hypothetical protein
MTYAAETWCLKAKTIAKLNSTEMDLWRRSARISRKDKIRNNIKTKLNSVALANYTDRAAAAGRRS